MHVKRDSKLAKFWRRAKISRKIDEAGPRDSRLSATLLARLSEDLEKSDNPLMGPGRKLPEDPLAFIRGCILGRRLLWTYHVNMRLAGRHISRDEILAAAERYELVESYPDDKYLPSYLLADVQPTGAFHVLFAVDVDADQATIVTAYRPHPDEWGPDLKTRRTQP